MVMGAFPSCHLLVVLILILLSDFGPALSCLESERQALLMLKGGLVDEGNRLGSWVDVGGGSCCDWFGVSCNNSTGHVIGLRLQHEYDPELHLSYEAYNRTMLRGTISPSVLHLKQLVHLNLGGNDFGGTRIPPFLGLMTSLQQLDLSGANFSGIIPSQIGNLTNLDYLGLARNTLSGDSLQWVSSLSLLHHLDLSHVDLSKARDWFHSIKAIPFLSELILSECELDHLLPSVSVSVSLLNNFSSLVVLYLSDNDFEHSSVPQWIFHLHNLNTLDLSGCNFQAGPIPEGFQNLSRLRSLHLSFNNFNSSIPSWLYSFSSELEFLELSYNKLQGVISSAIGNLTSLTELWLGGLDGDNLEIGGRETLKSMGQLCHLKHLGLTGVKVNQDVVDVFHDLFSSSCPSNGLESLDLGSAGIFGNLTNVPFEKLKSLVYLSLSNNLISGSIPPSFGELQSLVDLDMSDNSISGSIPPSFGELQSLVYLSLFHNSISGSIPPSFGELQSLESAYLDGNSMVGSVSETHFAKLARLKRFRASGNKLELKVSPSWIPPFQLKYLDLSSWQLGEEFPRWLHSQKSISNLKLSGCSIEGAIPEWLLGNMSSQIERLNLSNNQLKGEVPIIFSSSLYELDLSNNSLESLSKGFWNGSLAYLYLSNNQIAGEMPSSLAFMEAVVVDLKSNKFHGRLPPFSSNLYALDLSDNSFIGSLSHFLCYQMNQTKRMHVLNLANNLLYGEIPDCWMSWNSLTTLRMNNNNFTGRLPSSMENLKLLESLHLRNNNLVGGLHILLRSCQNLVVLDLSENQMQGEIPSSIGKSNMTILSLRSNGFHGKLPEEICALGNLQIIDLANNNLIGSIPRCINQLSAMIINESMGSQISKQAASLQVGGHLEDAASFRVGNYTEDAILRKEKEDAVLVIKGRTMEFNTTLNLVRAMDFSNNFFTGKIPDEVTVLVALQSLNLSQNMLNGEIPQNIGAMRLLESLDLSLNKLVGEIPSSISTLNFLNHLNLSSNNLTGRIPSSTQLQSFNASCFVGNELCGSPLAKGCDEDEATPLATDSHYGTLTTFVDVEWFFVSMAFGFVFGFWGFMFHLICNRQWRIAYFSFLDRSGIFIRELVNRYM